ncbi:hypothetical protein BD289DRAFT_109557 [Coniella lustricola]|uniref:Uncharacterized protein n=1 Tax=Coniella lustricola TaxID=2025994 RepID=A0A2T2ZXF4_9PEZI|nr:hypothetical protein BD289DRAFT_109557 [Coniella lustricola]
MSSQQQSLLGSASFLRQEAEDRQAWWAVSAQQTQTQTHLSQHQQDSLRDVTVVEIGGRGGAGAPSRNHSLASDYRPHHLDAQDLQDGSRRFSNRSSFAHTPRPLALKLFFLPSPNHETTIKSSSSPPDILQVIQVRFGLRTSAIVDQAVHDHDHDHNNDHDDHDEDTVSPTASPRRPRRITASEIQPPHVRFEGIDDDDDDQDLTKKQSDNYRPLKSWTWEMRHLHATVQVLADAHTTVYFCMNLPTKLQRRITDSVRSMEALAKNPLFMDTLIIDEVIAFYRDLIKSFRTRMIATNNDTSRSSTETSIRLEELATTWRAILRDIHATIHHIHYLQDLAHARPSRTSSSFSSSTSSSYFPMSQFHFQDGGGHHRGGSNSTNGGSGSGSGYSHTRQKSSEVFGPQALEVLELQHSTCEFWARCVSMYLERTTDRARSSTLRLRKTIPLRRRGSLPEINRRLSNFTIDIAVQVQRNSASVSTLAVVRSSPLVSLCTHQITLCTWLPLYRCDVSPVLQKLHTFNSSTYHPSNQTTTESARTNHNHNHSPSSAPSSSAPTASSSPSRTGGGSSSPSSCR